VDTIGQTLTANEVFGTVEAVKTVSDLYLPVGGEILELNSELESNPDYVNNDPYQNGWMVKVKVSDKSEFDALMSADDYKNLVGA
jgi:glycine cleavage system H protein